MTAPLEPVLRWRITPFDAWTVATFEIARTDGLLEPGTLAAVDLPPDLRSLEPFGVIFSGRGPIWLFAHLVHLAHPFAWVGVHDPRLGGAVTVTRHRKDAPALGEVVRFEVTP